MSKLKSCENCGNKDCDTWEDIKKCDGVSRKNWMPEEGTLQTQGNQKENKPMNEKLLKLLELLKKYNGGEVSPLMEEEFKAFAQYDEPIETVDDLIEAMKDEMSYWEED